MPLSKARNRDRMRLARLHAKKHTEPVQPKAVDRLEYYRQGVEPPVELDADGNPIPEY